MLRGEKNWESYMKLYIYIWNNSYSYLYSPNSMFIPCSYQNDYGFRECTPHPSRSSMVIVHDPFDEIHP